MTSNEENAQPVPDSSAATALTTAEMASLLNLRSRVHRRVIDSLEDSTVRPAQRSDHDFLVLTTQAMISIIIKEVEGPPLTSRLRARLLQEVLNEVVALGPLQPLLDDPSVSEIIVNHPREVIVERKGKFERVHDIAFDDNAHILRIMQQILAPLGRRLDESSPLVDARLPDGSRLNVVIPPVALASPLVTIRKRPPQILQLQDLVANESLTEEMADFLRACVQGKLNILISGGPACGKTTLLRALAHFIPAEDRIITIEDSAELGLQHENLAAMESRPPSAEDRGEVTIRDLVRNALRMHPIRIIVGEVRSIEALDMLQAMNTGTSGSLATIHSNSPRDTIHRLETLCMMSSFELPQASVARQIASAINLIVHQDRFPDGSRKVTHITEVYPDEQDHPILQDIFTCEARVASGGEVVAHHRTTDLVPRCVDRLARAGQAVTHLFQSSSTMNDEPSA